MNWFHYKKKTLGLMFVALFTVTGTYNAVVINSESYLAGHDLKFVKRLDEIYGVTVSNRDAASVNWKKLTPTQVVQHRQAPAQVVQNVSVAAAAPETTSLEEVIPAAAVQEELSLNLVEVINAQKWKNGLTNTQFAGSLTTNQGIIESLEVSLPNGEGVSVSFSEMTGNVFEYDLNGELYSGMMYQVDQNSYMVTMSNGPLEGTRMRFTGAPSEEAQLQAQVAADYVDVGQYGNDADDYDRQQLAEQTLYDAQNSYEAQVALNADVERQNLAENYDLQMQQQGMSEQAIEEPVVY